MIKPKDVLKVARWRYPDENWSVSNDGTVFATGRVFSLTHPVDQQAVCMKLRKDHGWKVYEVTRSGNKEWKADNGKGGTAESPSLPRLLVVLVDRVSEGRG